MRYNDDCSAKRICPVFNNLVTKAGRAASRDRAATPPMLGKQAGSTRPERKSRPWPAHWTRGADRAVVQESSGRLFPVSPRKSLQPYADRRSEVRRCFWRARRFNRVDPFFGNIQDPLSLHKYLYVHGDSVTSMILRESTQVSAD